MHPETLSTAAPAGAPAALARGLCAGTRVMTLRGAIAVEALRPGDTLVTRDSGTATLEGVSTGTMRLAAMKIRAGSLGHTGTATDPDVTLPPDALVHVRDWRAPAFAGCRSANLPAARLHDGAFVTRAPEADVTLYALHLASPHILYADGVEVLSV